MDQTVLGIFNSHAAAEEAAQRLVSRGFDRSDIDIKSTEAGEAAPAAQRGVAADDRGFMESVGDFFGNLFGSDEDKEYAGHYAEAVRRGSAVLTLDTDDSRIAEAHDALEDAGAVDIEEQVAAWRAGGYSGFDTKAPAFSAGEAATDRDNTIPVIQEELEVGKRKVSGGTVRVVSRVTSKPVHESVELRSETASVERRPVDRAASEADLAGFEDRTIEVKEMSEKAVVNKTARVVEEVVIGKQVSHETQTIDDTVRRTDVEVDRSGTGADGVRDNGRMAFDDHDEHFRSDYDSRYATAGGSYSDYEPAYRSGFAMRDDARYAGQDWRTVEPHAQRDWESKNPGTWERMKGAVERGWDKATR